jgi:hypothetical protein
VHRGLLGYGLYITGQLELLLYVLIMSSYKAVTEFFPFSMSANQDTKTQKS